MKFSELQVKITGNMSELEETFRRASADLAKFQADAARSAIGFTKLGETFSSVGTKLSAGITLPLVGAAMAVVAAAESLDQAQAKIRVGTGATGEALAALNKNFEAVFGQVPQAAGEVAAAIADLNTRLGLTGEPLERVAKQVLDLSDMTGEQLQPLIASTTRVMGDWGRSNEQTSDTLDYLFKVSQATGIGVTSLSEKIVQFGAPLRQMGFNFDQAAALIGKFEREGVNTELVLGGLRVALARMAREGITDASAGLQEIIRRIQAVKPGAEQTAIALEYFGAKVGSDMAAAIGEGRFEITEFLRVLDASTETIAKADKGSETLAETCKVLRNQITLAVAPLGKELVPVLKDLIETGLKPAAGKAQELVEWFSELDPAAKKAAFGVAAVGAAAGPVILVLGQLLLAVNQLRTLLPVLGVVGGAALGALAAKAAAVAGGVYAIYRVVDASNEARDASQELARAKKEELYTLFQLERKLIEVKAPIEALRQQYESGAITVEEYRRGLMGLAKAAGDAKGQTQQVGVVVSESAASSVIASAGFERLGEAVERAAGKFVSLRDALAEMEARAESKRFVDEWVRGLVEVREGIQALIDPPNIEDFGRQALSAADFVKVLGSQMSETAALAGALQFPGMTGSGMPKMEGPAADYWENWIKANEAAGKTAGQRFSRGMSVGMMEVSTVFNDVERGIARVIVGGGKIGEVGKKAGQEFAEAMTRLALRQGLTPLIMQMDVLLGKVPLLSRVFGGAAGSTPGVGGFNPGGGGGSLVGSITAGWVGAAGSIASAVSGVIGNVQMAGMNKSLDLLVKHTLQTVMVGEASFYMTKERLDWINDRLIEFRQLGVGVYGQPGYDGIQLAGAAAGGGLTINWGGNMYGGPAGIGELTDAIVRELRRRGVRIG